MSKWRKSSRSESVNCVQWCKSTRCVSEYNCVEFRTSTYSLTGNCVEVAGCDCTGQVVLVRDTKDNGEGPILDFAYPAWNSFLGGVRSGMFDLRRSSVG